MNKIRLKKSNLKKKNFIFKLKKKKVPRLFNLERKVLSNLEMPQDSLQILLGTLLGDGSLKINKKYVNARFQMKHAIRYSDWFKWKAEKLSLFASLNSTHVLQPSFGSYTKKPRLHFQTLTHPELTKVHSVVTINNKLKIKRRWLNHLQPLALMVWWLDDGALTANMRQGLFCCESFSKKEQEILVKYLRTVWDIEARVVTHRVIQKEKGVKVNEYLANRIKLNTTELKKFLKIIMPYLPCESLVYKVCVRYNNSKLQQRWISEVKRALPQYETKIDAIYNKDSLNLSDKDIVQ